MSAPTFATARSITPRCSGKPAAAARRLHAGDAPDWSGRYRVSGRRPRPGSMARSSRSRLTCRCSRRNTRSASSSRCTTTRETTPRSGRAPTAGRKDSCAGCAVRRRPGQPGDDAGSRARHPQCGQDARHANHIGREFNEEGVVPRLGPDVPQWLGETIGFWDGEALITWTSNIQGWISHGGFEFSSGCSRLRSTRRARTPRHADRHQAGNRALRSGSVR